MNFLKVSASASVLVVVAACGQNGAADAATGATVTEKQATSQPADEAVDLSAAPSGLYKADQGHRYITFTYDHQGFSAPFVRWRNWDADLNWNLENPSASSVSATIEAASIDTGVDEFDGHLKGEKFFDVENHPTITFVSTSLETTGPGTGKMVGDLTIKGVTKPVILDVTFNKAAFNERAKAAKIGFSGRTTVLRSDFGVDLAVPFVSDEVKIIIESEFDQQLDAE